jgi:hypothetical protein
MSFVWAEDICMKGRFTLYGEYGLLRIGKLGKENEDVFAYLIENDPKFSPQVVAHDIVEHKQNHVRNVSVTFEDELQALGASNFIRGLDSMYQICDQIELLGEKRYVDEIPKHWVMRTVAHMNDFSLTYFDDLMDFCINQGYEGSFGDVKNAAMQYWYGYACKYQYYKGNCVRAADDFEFIKDNVRFELETNSLDDNEKITFVYDTEKQMFKTNKSNYFGTPYYE